ncbi:MAG TPA: hypothetical protein VN947_25190 [Polyangia bacterium]|nr:hypothetical protein [Polyangia bacterium]
MLLVALLRPAAPPATAPMLELDAVPLVEPSRSAPSLAAVSMAPDERRRLRLALVELATRLEVRAHPLADDLEDGPVDAELRAALKSALPKLTAARALLAGAWHGSAGGDGVHVVDGCAAGRACIDPWARDGDAAARRARFLAWPLSAAALVRFDDAAGAGAAAARLRARAAARDSRIALVLGTRELDADADADADGDADAARELEAIRAAATRAARLLAHDAAHGEARALLADVAAAGAPAPPSWLRLDARELYVVPRLGSVAALDAFVAEVTTYAPGARFERRPRPLD